MAKSVATVEDFNDLANEDTGLVPMKFLKPTITEFKGDIRGAEPVTALRWYNDGLAEPLEGVKTKPNPQPAGAVTAGVGGVPIPEGWEGLHHLQQIQLAKQLTGASNMTAEEARTAIQAELAKRAK